MKSVLFLSEKIKQILIFLALWIGFIVLFGTPTALIPNPFIRYVRMIPAAPLDYAFLVIISGLLAFYLSFSNKPKSNLPVGIASVAGFISFACPICNYLLVAALGFPFVLSTIEPLRPFLGIISIGSFLLLFYLQWTKRCIRLPLIGFLKSKKVNEYCVEK